MCCVFFEPSLFGYNSTLAALTLVTSTKLGTICIIKCCIFFTKEFFFSISFFYE